jgi:hypothetical protein
MFSTLFWRDALERALSTAAQAFVATVGVDAVLNVSSFDWGTAAAVSAGAAVLSVVKALAASKVSGTVSPASLVQTPTKF